VLADDPVILDHHFVDGGRDRADQLEVGRARQAPGQQCGTLEVGEQDGGVVTSRLDQVGHTRVHALVPAR
jgi:hypothetical protein